MRLIAILLAALIAGCAGDDHDDLRQWMRENTKDLRGNVTPLPPVVPYVPVAYSVDGAVDPFAPAKLEPDSSTKQWNDKIQQLLSAREQRNNLLEKFPLESQRMIGYLRVNNQPIAVLQVEQNVKQVKVGDYVGQDFGLVVQITEREMALRELVQDPTGEWTERTSTLQVQGKEGNRK